MCKTALLFSKELFCTEASNGAYIEVRGLAKSAGLIDDPDFIKKSSILNNMKNVVSLTQETTKLKGRANDDRRSLEQSVVLSSMPSTRQILNAKERQQSLPSSRQIAKVIGGLNPRTFQRIKQKVQRKRDLLEQVTNGILPRRLTHFY